MALTRPSVTEIVHKAAFDTHTHTHTHNIYIYIYIYIYGRVLAPDALSSTPFARCHRRGIHRVLSDMVGSAAICLSLSVSISVYVYIERKRCKRTLSNFIILHHTSA